MTGSETDISAGVLSLHWGYSPGGVAKYGVLLDRAAKRYGIELLHLCIRGGAWPVDTETLAQLGAREIIIRSRWDTRWIGTLASCLKKLNPALVMTHGFNGHFVVQLMSVFRYYTGPTVCSYHGQYHATTFAREFPGRVFNRFTEWYIGKSLRTMAVAEYTKDYLIERGVSPDRVDVIHNGIEDVRLDEGVGQRLRRIWRVTPANTVIGVASRLDPVKGVRYLVSAFTRLAARHESIVLVLVGSGTEVKHLEKQIETCGLTERVRFLGFRSDVAACLAAFDIFVLPSVAEYHSIGLLEAMRAAKPIVATNVGGNTESVRDAKEALVVPPESAEALEEALERLLSDQPLCERLSSNARRRYLEEFSEEVMLMKTAAWLDECATLALSHRA
jgi:glycosyltransferase involved in cell wall biosynthesis